MPVLDLVVALTWEPGLLMSDIQEFKDLIIQTLNCGFFALHLYVCCFFFDRRESIMGQSPNTGLHGDGVCFAVHRLRSVCNGGLRVKG